MDEDEDDADAHRVEDDVEAMVRSGIEFPVRQRAIERDRTLEDGSIEIGISRLFPRPIVETRPKEMEVVAAESADRAVLGGEERVVQGESETDGRKIEQETRGE